GSAAGQVPVGAFIDRIGTRTGLAAIFIAWSMVGGAHALASGLLGFVALRFLMGLRECGNYRGGMKGGGFSNAGGAVGSIVAPPVVVFIATHLGWRLAFLVPAVVGLLWLIPWL